MHKFSVISRAIFMPFLRFLVSVFVILHSTFLFAQGPAWWYARGAVDTNLQANDYAGITCGQLKWMATNACAEIEACFGAGYNVMALVSGFSNSNNYYLANIGQVKYVVQPFYDRLYEFNLTNTFPANMPGYYPWGNSSSTNDYAAANIGQVKYVFSFDSAKDSDDDGLSDWQEVAYGTNPYDPDTDGDGLPDGWEAAHGFDPVNISHVAFDCSEDTVWWESCSNYNAAAHLTLDSVNTELEWTIEELNGQWEPDINDGIFEFAPAEGGRYKVVVNVGGFAACSATTVVNVAYVDLFKLDPLVSRNQVGILEYKSTLYCLENSTGQATMTIESSWTPSLVTGMMWRIVNLDGAGTETNWSTTMGMCVPSTNVTWTGGEGISNRHYAVWMGRDLDGNGILETNEFKINLNVTPTRVSMIPPTFVPRGGTNEFVIKWEPDMELLLNLWQNYGAGGEAVFGNGSNYSFISSGCATVKVCGVESSSSVDDMCLSVTEFHDSFPIEENIAHTELKYYDFTVGEIQVEVDDGYSSEQWPFSINTNGPITAVVSRGQDVTLTVTTEPADLANEIFWNSGSNGTPATGQGASFTTHWHSGWEWIRIKVGVNGPVIGYLRYICADVVSVTANDVYSSPACPSTYWATTDPAGFESYVSWSFDPIPVTPGRGYTVTGTIGDSSASSTFYYYYPPSSYGWSIVGPNLACVGCDPETLTLHRDREENGVCVEDVLYTADEWRSQGTPSIANNTDTYMPSYATPLGGTDPVTATCTYGGTTNIAIHYMSLTYDNLLSLSCLDVTVTNATKTVFMRYDTSPSLSATKICGNCPWSESFSGAVNNENNAGNLKTANIALSSPGSYQVSISQGEKSLSLDVEGLNVKYATTEALNLAWTQNGSFDMKNELANNVYDATRLDWTLVSSTGDDTANFDTDTAVLYFGANCGGSYNIHVASSDLPSCEDTKMVNAVYVDIGVTEMNVWIGEQNVVIDLTNSCLGSGTATWTSEPEGISESGNSISFCPANLAPGTYTITAESTVLPECYDTCIVHIPERDLLVKCETNNPQPDKAGTTEPINTMSGANYFNENDLIVSCPGLSLEFVRSYNSAQNHAGVFGKGWTHSYEWSLTPITNNGAEPREWMMLRAADGREFKFPKQDETFGPCLGNDLMLEVFGSGYTVTFPAGIVYSFNTNGALENIRDAWDNCLTLSYTDGKLTQVAHGNGQILTFTYDGTGRPTNVWAATDSMVSFGYDGQRLTSATRNVGSQTFQTTYEYNDDSAITRRTNARGDISEYGYTTNAAGAALKGSSLNVGGYYTHSLSYDTNKTTVTYTRGAENQVHEYYYNPEILRLSKIDGPGDKEINYQYDNNDNITNETVAASTDTLTTWRQYDTNHNVTQSAIGYNATPSNSITYEWHESYHLPTLITDPEGNKVGYEYQNGSISRVKAYYTANDSYDTVFTYATNGLLTQVATPNGGTIGYTYDAYGHPASATPSAGPALTYQYNQLGHLEQVTWPDNRHIHYESDAQGWVKNITYPDNSMETFAYDGIGNLTNHVDQAGRATRMTYLPTRKLSSMSRMLDGQSVGITYEYDQQMNSLCIRDAQNRAVEGYQLDIHDRPVTITNVEGQVMTVTYGLESFVKSVTRFDGTSISNAYDGDGRLIQIKYPDDTLDYAYSPAGHLLTVTDSAGTVSNVYTALGRLTWTKGITVNSDVSYGYYPAGQVSAVTSAAGVVSYSLDAGDRLSAISSPVGTFNYSYNATNGLIDGVSCAAISATNTFDLLDRIADITWNNSSNNVVRGFAYGYSAAGMITQKVTTLNGQLATNIYGYDSLDRLISETSGTSTVHYAYDLVGNRTQMVQNGATVSYTLGQGNKLSSWGANGENTISYNTAGCVTQICVSGDNAQVLAWNSRYQVTEVRTNGIVAETYKYDAFGRRISISDGATTNYLVYDGIHAIAETDASGTLLKSYTYGPGIDNILTMSVYTNSGGTTSVASVFYYVKDHLGSVAAVADSGGQIVESYQYDAWGNVLEIKDGSGTSIGQSAIGNRFLWQGREYSWATHLYYFRARWYEPVTGRWLSNDPIGISGGLNQYVFCSDNPVNFRDPWGLCGDGEKEVSIEQRRIRAVQPFGLLMWLWDSMPLNRMDYGYRSVYDGLPSSYQVGGRIFHSTMIENEFSNYMIGRIAYNAGGNLGYGLARLGGNIGAWVDFRRSDDAGSIEMLRLGRQDAIRASDEASRKFMQEAEEMLRIK
ncbi:MAG: DUF6531 domain-containing protein [Kiritimatiellae bacterium]|nr:DUF6531 domain-containing protein [Kiritimatiellia bacterium]